MSVEVVSFVLSAIVTSIGLFGSWFFNFTSTNPLGLNKKKVVSYGLPVILLVLMLYALTIISYNKTVAQAKSEKEIMIKQISSLQASSSEINTSLNKALTALNAISKTQDIYIALAKNPNSRRQFNDVVQDKYISSLAANDKSIASTMSLMRIVSKAGAFSETPPVSRSSISGTASGYSKTMAEDIAKKNASFIETPPVLQSPKKSK